MTVNGEISKLSVKFRTIGARRRLKSRREIELDCKRMEIHPVNLHDTPHIQPSKKGVFWVWNPSIEEFERYETLTDAKARLEILQREEILLRPNKTTIYRRSNPDDFRRRRERLPILSNTVVAMDPRLNRLRRTFLRERRVFSRVFPALKATQLWLLPNHCISRKQCEKRDLAAADLENNRVLLVQRVLKFDSLNWIGLIRHELGHLADPTPDLPGAEARADQIALEVTGQRINYDDMNIQTTGRGGPRPKWLHQ